MVEAPHSPIASRPNSAQQAAALEAAGATWWLWAWLAWTGRRLGMGRVPELRPPVSVLHAGVVMVVAFAVLRNLPFAPFSALAP